MSAILATPWLLVISVELNKLTGLSAGDSDRISTIRLAI